MNSETELPDIISGILYFQFRAFMDGSNTDVRAYMLYEDINGMTGTVSERKPEHVDGVIAAFDKLNQRWPGFLTQVHPPKPQPADRRTVLWIMNPSVIWKQGDWFLRPTMEEVYREAGAS